MSDKKQSAVSSQQSAKDLQVQIAELTEALKRERADSDNIRRRHDEQIGSLKNIVKANIVSDLLPVIDNFERALKHQPANSGQSTADSQDNKHEDWIKGVMSIKTQFDKTLEQLGVERIKTVGEKFDPRLHEAVTMEDGDGTVEVICDELQPGYKLGDDIIRHAMVKVKMVVGK